MHHEHNAYGFDPSKIQGVLAKFQDEPLFFQCSLLYRIGGRQGTSKEMVGSRDRFATSIHRLVESCHTFHQSSIHTFHA
jgi:hypothetical protein